MKWRRWSRRAEQWSEELREEAREQVSDFMPMRGVAIAIGVLAVILLVLGIYWSREPAPFNVTASVQKVLRESSDQPVVGVVTTATLAQVVTTLLDKRGGFINNDIAPPGLWLDNISHWERGALQQARDMARSLRDDFGRPADDFGRTAADAEPDDDLARAEPRLNFSANSWMLPASESQYHDARDYLLAYVLRLQQHDERTLFAATPANLDHYLARVTVRLDNSVQRLSASVTPRENPLLQSNASTQPPTKDSHLDNVFYEARGSAWALLHLLRAIEIDFSAVLREKNAQSALQEAIRALDATQDTIYSPIILNGSGFGLVANHSLVMASYMARADTAVATVRLLLTETAPAPTTTVENTTNETESTTNE